MDNEIMSFQEMTQFLDISSNRLSRVIKKGLPYVSLGGESKVFIRSSVEEWLKTVEKEGKR